MPSDLQALLAVVVADPSDDVARLVYADCLEESGNATRAAFIRVQIEAERHHPDSNARAALESQAGALFAEHWVGWWDEVCFVVGFPPPAPKLGGRLGRLASRVGLRTAPGVPYRASGFRIAQAGAVQNFQALRGYSCCRFRRGFPDAVELSYGRPDFLPRWPGVSPVHSLTLHDPHIEDWIDGPHLAGVRELELRDYGADVLLNLLSSPHCGNLQRLCLESPLYAFDENGLMFAYLFGSITKSWQMPHIRELSLPVWRDNSAERVADAPRLAGLTSLRVSLASDDDDDIAAASQRLAILARSPHLAGLTQLSLTGGLDANGLTAAIHGPTWSGLRKLELDLQYNHGRLDPLGEPDGLASLDEFRLLGVHLDDAGIAVLARSPLLKRVRHFAFAGRPIDGTTLPKLAGALDRDRIETFTLALPTYDPLREYTAKLLWQWFGDRAKVVER